MGIVEPVDDVRVSNPASNPELLDELGKQFTEYKYDFKKLVRDICNSRTYQRSTAAEREQRERRRGTSPTPTSAASGPRRCSTASAQVTETKDKFPGLPLGARAVQIADGSVSTYFLTTFGRATRETVCSCEVKMEPTLSQALHLLNGDTTTRRSSQGGLIAEALAEKKTPEQIIEELYVRMPEPQADAEGDRRS